MFKKVEEQLELCNTVRIDLRQISTTTFETQSGYIVTKESCSCTFYSAMKVPCRHIFKLLQSQECDLFVPSLCLERWTKQYYNTSHPALSANEQRILPQPISVHRLRVPDEISKYKKTATVTKEINNLAASMSSSQYDYFLDKIQKLRHEMSNPAESVHEEISEQNVASNTRPNDPLIIPNLTHAALNPVLNVDLSARSSNSIGLIANTDVTSSSAHEFLNQNVSMTNANFSMDRNSFTPLQVSSMPHQNISIKSTPSNSQDSAPQQVSSMSNPSISIQPPSFEAQEDSSMPSIISPNNSQRSDVSTIKLPSKIKSVGRPKGSGQTVIGTKKKMHIYEKRKSDETVTSAPAKRKFLDLSAADQSIKIVQWLTNKTPTEIMQKKVSCGDIIQDSNIFNRLRNDGINLIGIKKFLDTKCISYLKSEVDRLNGLIWGCTKCKKNLRGKQIMCNGCLDWYHLNCASRQNHLADTFFCDDCK